MKYLKFITVSIIFPALLLISCSETSNSPQIPVDYSHYFPMTTGSWWITERYSLDDNMNRKELTSKDSIAVVGTELKGGKTATVFITYDIDTDDPIDTSYYYMEGSKVYEFTTATPFPGDETWLLMEDFAANKPWTVLDSNFTNANMEDGSLFTGSITATIKKGEGKTVEVKGQNYSTTGFDVSMNMNGNITSQGMTFPISLKAEGNLYFAEGIGQVQSLNKMSMEAGGQNMKMNQESIVVDYNIK